MEWLERMAKALNYLEDYMEDEIDVNEAAKVACSSPFHFQRMFSMLTGATVAEYVRKRRLTLAAQELSVSDIKVIDAALKYGYDTPESFSKAFRKLHGVSPTESREPGVSLKAYPRISFKIYLKGDKDMDYKLIKKEEFKVVGKTRRISTKDGCNFVEVPKFWQEFVKSGDEARLCKLASPMGELGICMEMDHQAEEFTYMIGVEKTEAPVPEDLVEKTIPAATWAVFESVGPMPGAIQKVWERIFSEWFPSTGFEHSGGPELEVYPEGDASSEDYRCEVWIPVIKK